MSSYHEAVKRILSEFNRFLKVTLSSESLSPSAEKDRKNVLKLLQKLFADYDNLAPSSGDEGSISSSKDAISCSLDESRNTVDSSHGSEDDSYTDNIPDMTVQALSEPVKIGYLDRRHEYLITFKWQKRYCVLHKNIFYIFKKPDNKKQQGAFYLTGYELREAPQLVKEEKKKECCFELVCPGKKSYQFLCESKDDLQSWREVIVAASIKQPAKEPEISDGIYEGFDENAGATLTTVEENDDDYDDTLAENTPCKPKVLALTLEEDADNLIYEPIDTVSSQSPARLNLVTLKSASTPPPPVPSHSPRLPPPPPVASPKDLESPPPPVLPQRVPEPQPPTLPAQRGQPLPPLPPQEPAQTAARPLPPLPTEPLPAVPPTPKKMTSPNLGKILHPSEDFENLFFGKWDCTGSTDNELTFRRGQIVHVISRDLDKHDWWIGALDDKVGLVPKSYLSPAYEQIR